MPATPSDPIINGFATHTINLLRVAAGFRAKAWNVLTKLQKTLVGAVSNATSLNQRSRMAAFLQQTNASIKAGYDILTGQQLDGLTEIAILEAPATAEIIGSAMGANVVSVAVSESQLAAVVNGKNILGHSAADWWAGQSVQLQQRFTGAMQQGVLLGESTQQLVNRVRGTAANNFKDGIMEVSRRDAASLVRTSVISTSNAARQVTLEGMQDVVKGLQWVATLDLRTSEICRALDGCAWSLPGYEPIPGPKGEKAWPGVTAHWQCRSTQVPVLRSWEELSGKKLPSLNDQELESAVKKKLAARGMNQSQIDAYQARSRASMDGQVHESTTFDDWLKSKSDKQVDDVLGPGRAELWDRGKGLTVSEMTDQSNRPLTLDQLRQKVKKGTPLPETMGVDYFALDPNGKIIPAAKQVDTKAIAAEMNADTLDAAADGIAASRSAGIRLTAAQQRALDNMDADQISRLDAKEKKLGGN